MSFLFLFFSLCFILVFYPLQLLQQGEAFRPLTREVRGKWGSGALTLLSRNLLFDPLSFPGLPAPPQHLAQTTLLAVLLIPQHCCLSMAWLRNLISRSVIQMTFSVFIGGGQGPFRKIQLHLDSQCHVRGLSPALCSPNHPILLMTVSKGSSPYKTVT